MSEYKTKALQLFEKEYLPKGTRDKYKLIVIPSFRTPNEIIKKAYNSFGHDHIVYKEVNKRFYEIGSFKGINELKKFFKKRYEKF